MVLHRYGCELKGINFQSDNIDVGVTGSTSYVAGKTSVQLDLLFYEIPHLKDFFEQIANFDKAKAEQEKIKQLHDKYPTLKEAYEQYQILLKLYHQ